MRLYEKAFTLTQITPNWGDENAAIRTGIACILSGDTPCHLTMTIKDEHWIGIPYMTALMTL